MRRDRFEQFIESGALAAAADALASERLSPGETIARYRIVEEIGHGGMGTVYRAFDTKLRRDVALKLLLTGHRSLSEARAAAALKHPNIGVVFELGETDGRTYLAMELIEGETLAERLEKGPIETSEALSIAIDVSEGLAHAHRRGVLHRDVKPANVMLTEHGARIIDFGLAGIHEAESEGPMGTPAYASPEQARGGVTDERSDIYSVGILLKELLGRRCRRIVERCCATEPEDRYESAETLSRALKRAAGGASPWRRPAVIFGAVAAVLAIVVLSRPEPPTATLTNPIPVTSDVGVEERARWSPDGKTLAYHSNVSGDWDIWIVREGGRPSNLTSSDDRAERFPSWSPDGRRIAFWADGEVFIMPIHEGAPRRIAAADTGSAPQWSRDGSRVLVIDGTDAALINVSDDRAERVPLPGAHTSRFDLSWSHDERFVAYVDANAPVDELTRLRALRLSDGASFELTDGQTNVRSPSWSTGNDAVNYVSNRGGDADLWRRAFTADGPSGEPQRLTVGIGIRDASWSKSGARLVYSKGRRVANLWRVPAGPGVATWRDAQQLTFDQALVEFADVASDGERVVLSSDRSGNQDLWVLTLSSSELRQLTEHPAADWSPTWSPDGETIVFYSHRSGNRDVWLASRAGDSLRQMTHDDAEDYRAAFSPDATMLAFDSTRGGSWDIWTLDIESGALRQRTFHPGIDSDARFAPDGSRLVFGSQRDGEYRLWELPLGGSGPTRLTEGAARNPRWSPDGRHIFFHGEGARAGDIFRLDLATREEVAVTDFRGRRGALGVSALATDGVHVYFTWEEDLADIWTMDLDVDVGAYPPLR